MIKANKGADRNVDGHQDTKCVSGSQNDVKVDLVVSK